MWLSSVSFPLLNISPWDDIKTCFSVLPDSSFMEATSASVDVGTLPEVQLVSKRTGPEGSAAHALRRPHLAGRVCAELRARSKNEATR